MFSLAEVTTVKLQSFFRKELSAIIPKDIARDRLSVLNASRTMSKTESGVSVGTLPAFVWVETLDEFFQTDPGKLCFLIVWTKMIQPSDRYEQTCDAVQQILFQFDTNPFFRQLAKEPFGKVVPGLILEYRSQEQGPINQRSDPVADAERFRSDLELLQFVPEMFQKRLDRAPM